MSLTRAQAIDEICARATHAWVITAAQAGGRLKYPDVASKLVPPDDQLPWATITLRHTSSTQATLAGELGRRRFRRSGVVTVQVFEPAGQGLAKAVDIPQIIQHAFEGHATAGGIWFRNVTLSEIGQSGAFHQTNISAIFEYDEIR